jgi:hypothetical protein
MQAKNIMCRTSSFGKLFAQYPWAEQAYFLFPPACRHFPEPPVGRYGNDGLLDIQVAVSRDGVHWARLAREPYVALGAQEDPDSSQLYMAVGMIRRGGKLFEYYGGYQTTQGQSDLASLRGRAVRLRVVMRACKLFAFQFP